MALFAAEVSPLVALTAESEFAVEAHLYSFGIVGMGVGFGHYMKDTQPLCPSFLPALPTVVDNADNSP